MRAVALLLTLFCLLTVYFVARSWISARRAVVVVLLVLSGMGFLRRVLGVQQLADLSRSRAPLMLTLTAAMAVVTTLATAQVVAYGAMPGPGRLSASTVPVARRLKSDGPCLLVTGYAPELGWYPGCDTASYAHFRRTPPPPAHGSPSCCSNAAGSSRTRRR